MCWLGPTLEKPSNGISLRGSNSRPQERMAMGRRGIEFNPPLVNEIDKDGNITQLTSLVTSGQLHLERSPVAIAQTSLEKTSIRVGDSAREKCYPLWIQSWVEIMLL
jgi:hypothetical protein